MGQVFCDLKLQFFSAENFEKKKVLRKIGGVFEFYGKIRPNFNRYSNFGLFCVQKNSSFRFQKS